MTIKTIYWEVHNLYLHKIVRTKLDELDYCYDLICLDPNLDIPIFLCYYSGYHLICSINLISFKN